MHQAVQSITEGVAALEFQDQRERRARALTVLPCILRFDARNLLMLLDLNQFHLNRSRKNRALRHRARKHQSLPFKRKERFGRQLRKLWIRRIPRCELAPASARRGKKRSHAAAPLQERFTGPIRAVFSHDAPFEPAVSEEPSCAKPCL